MGRRRLLPLFFFLLIATSSAVPLLYNSLDVRPLSRPSTLDSALPWSETLEATESTTDSAASSSPSLVFRLEHRDSLALNSSAAELFSLRLDRDSARVYSIDSRLAQQTHGRPISHGPSGAVPRPRRNVTRHLPSRRPRSFSSSIVSGLSQGSGEYFTRVGVGTPSHSMYMVVDTGSDVMWIQCSPCLRCYTQSDPLFNPRASSSFVNLPCSSPICRQLDTSGCSRRRSCLYQVSYGDGSSTVGDFSTETLTFGRTSIGRVALGCGHDNEGLFVGAAGLLGLGHGDLSFPSQVGRIFGRRFSYCLSDRQAGSTPSSTLIFGDAALPAPGRGAVFAPMVANPKLGTFYYVQLVGISVGGARVNVAASEFQISANGNGGVIVDSGTSVTRLVQPAYIAMRDAFRAGTTQLNRTTAGFSLFDTCYDLSGKDVVKVPTVVFHFGRGSDLSLPASNYLIPVNTAGLFCFAFAGTSSGLTIIGNIQQQGIRVVFDPVASRVGFVPHACG
ncbi:aspartyl protease family protein 2-like [Nymphaea colorata]|uniref:Peptidase A1 domain-containing protein n=1 Tax=Nymphaea colorata TaxID=210225 RepID=A0A5K1G960_9MAGN|nr:aspartyl protease family protein 2-like [Nymphaea colorata]